jgi:hypothetical protein
MGLDAPGAADSRGIHSRNGKDLTMSVSGLAVLIFRIDFW